MVYQMVATVVTLSDIEVGCRRFQMQSIEHLCSILHNFNELTVCSSSALAEFLVLHGLAQQWRWRKKQNLA